MEMVSLKDIAAKTGVPVPTVARILRGGNKERWPGAVERAAKVRAAAQKLGYRPNTSARAIRTGRTGCIALLLSSFQQRSVLFPEMLDGIQRALVDHDQHLTVATLPDAQLLMDGVLPKILREQTADGLLINYYAQVPDTLRRVLRKHGVPCIWLNVRQPSDCVYPDDRGAAERVTTELLALGHRRIAYIGTGDEAVHYSRVDRREGYEAAMRAAGLRPHVVDLTPFWLHGDRRVAECEALLKGENRPTACVTYELACAAPVLHAAGRLGLSYPRDLAVTTFHHDLHADVGLPLHVMRIPMKEVGRVGVEMLHEKTEAPRRAIPARAIPFGKAEGLLNPPVSE